METCPVLFRSPAPAFSLHQSGDGSFCPITRCGACQPFSAEFSSSSMHQLPVQATPLTAEAVPPPSSPDQAAPLTAWSQDPPATFAAFAQSQFAVPASQGPRTRTTLTPVPQTPAPPRSLQTMAEDSTQAWYDSQTSRSGSQSIQQPRASPKPLFAWTTEAADYLLRARFDTLKHRFQGTRSAKQLAAAWLMVTVQTIQHYGLEVSPAQCKSKVRFRQIVLLKAHLIDTTFCRFLLQIKHMHKQYTVCRVSQEKTGNDTANSLKEPPCYSTMGEVWTGRAGMDTVTGLHKCGIHTLGERTPSVYDTY
ncbi:unnamed protein product [Phytophthora fragariaefolia]|uniref:Unnamed protein product n=1 Tax=Phytophthora fragariaefolia TaxID=1490495 RepID=A0A9W6U208_9STRA|nr:unnamed protein product [Phytophthora fragariaefolia]